MKAYKIIPVLLAIILLFCGCGKLNPKVSKNIKEYLSTNSTNEKTEVEIELSVFTDFEWDKVVIYKAPTSSNDIYNLINIKYEPKDLCSGWLFIKDDKIIYEETFETDYESLPPFMVHPYKNINSKEKCIVIDKNNATFICQIYSNENAFAYSLYPKITSSIYIK